MQLKLVLCAMAFCPARSLRGARMQPEVVAQSLVKMENEWRSEAQVFAECNATAGSTSCNGAVKVFEKSCATIVSSVQRSSNGDRAIVNEYMGEICDRPVLQGWHKERCQTLSLAITGAMSADNYDNRQHLNVSGLCQSFWSRFASEESARVQKEKQMQQIEDQKRAAERAEAAKQAAINAAEEAAEREKLQKKEAIEKEKRHKAELVAKIQAEKDAEAKRQAEEQQRKVEEEQRKVEEDKAKAAEAKREADEEAAQLKAKEQEALRQAEEAKHKMEELKAAAEEAHRKSMEKFAEAATAKAKSQSNVTAKANAGAIAKPQNHTKFGVAANSTDAVNHTVLVSVKRACPNTELSASNSANAAGTPVFGGSAIPDNECVSVGSAVTTLQFCGPGDLTISRMTCDKHHEYKAEIISHPSSAWTKGKCEDISLAGTVADGHLGSYTLDC